MSPRGSLSRVKKFRDTRARGEIVVTAPSTSLEVSLVTEVVGPPLPWGNASCRDVFWGEASRTASGSPSDGRATSLTTQPGGGTASAGRSMVSALIPDGSAATSSGGRLVRSSAGGSWSCVSILTTLFTVTCLSPSWRIPLENKSSETESCGRAASASTSGKTYASNSSSARSVFDRLISAVSCCISPLSRRSRRYSSPSICPALYSAVASSITSAPSCIKRCGRICFCMMCS
mmetsp:Transcript_30637/g.91821  ORF Transcript_30637/g.91821 Transcript_30637/m.91821 type:complete len:233 (-) Transcript_30637:142-840(-)